MTGDSRGPREAQDSPEKGNTATSVEADSNKT